MVRRRARRAGSAAVAAVCVVAAAASPRPAAAQDAAVSATVRLPDPETARVEVRFAPGHPFREARELRRLVAGGEGGFTVESTGPATGWSGEVPVAPDGWVRIGIPLPAAAPPPGTDLSFRALIHPPPGFRITDPFPSRVEAQSDGSLRLDLPAPPSLIRFRLAPEGAGGITAAQLADLLIGLLLGALAVFGLSRLRRPSPEASS